MYLKNSVGPSVPFSEELHKKKYRGINESFEECMSRISNTLKDSDEHYFAFKKIIQDMAFLPAGRVQSDIGSPRDTTAFNCFVSGTIGDSMDSIMNKAKESAETLRRGGGIGYDFSTLRPRGDRIVSLDSYSSGPVAFMEIYNALCKTISSADHRRGAQMGVLRVDHPDIEEFIRAKQNDYNLTSFNISIAVTDKFMEHLKRGEKFPLTFNGAVYKYVNPQNLWDEIMRSTWDYAEPGVLFIDRINDMNNLKYCETIAATNPCGEQPLPPYGACLLGSSNIVKYIEDGKFLEDKFRKDLHNVVRSMDNIIDNTEYPLKKQEEEAKSKRRMGLGITGIANAGEMLGYTYGSKNFIDFLEHVLIINRDETYRASAMLAKEKGAFPLFNKEEYLKGEFIKTLPEDIRQLIAENGIRNSHLTSIAPTGTISLCADNVSSGIEPPYLLEVQRTIQKFDGEIIEVLKDYAYNFYGVEGKTANECTAEEHLKVLTTASKYVDSAVSKTCNIGDDVTFEDFKNIYLDAWIGGAKGITTFRPSGKRYGILNEVDKEQDTEDTSSEACFIDVNTGAKSCDA